MLKSFKSAALAGIFLFLSACAAAPPELPSAAAGDPSAMALLETPQWARGVDFDDLSEVDILELTPEMRAFVDERIKPHLGPKARLRELTYAVMDEGIFEIVYEEKTRTALETFLSRRGNCMSFTNLFVALARYAELDAHYQEVDVPPMWSFAGESFVINRHINVFVNLGYDSVRVVDFNINDFTTEYDSRIVSDARARAHYFNNIGAEAMLDGNVAEAFGNIRQSILEDDTFSPSWVNLGSLYRRAGNSRYAEAAYVTALRVNEESLVAMSNLASLYRANGQEELAQQYDQQVREHRNRNPYYHFYLATEAFTNAHYQQAIENLRRAIRLRDDEPRFYSLLSITYLMSGDKREALRWMEEAEKVAVEAAEKERYHKKLEVLMSHNRGG